MWKSTTRCSREQKLLRLLRGWQRSLIVLLMVEFQLWARVKICKFPLMGPVLWPHQVPGNCRLRDSDFGTGSSCWKHMRHCPQHPETHMMILCTRVCNPIESKHTPRFQSDSWGRLWDLEHSIGVTCREGTEHQWGLCWVHLYQLQKHTQNTKKRKRERERERDVRNLEEYQNQNNC